MKATLICPADRPAVGLLTRSFSPALTPMLGRSLLEHWLEHLACNGVSHVTILAAARPELARAIVANGARWGLKAEVTESNDARCAPVRQSFPAEQAHGQFLESDEPLWLEHFPAFPHQPLFRSYAGWFAALLDFMPYAAGPARIGVTQIKPGVWVGLKSNISPTARLRAPCWIGERVQIGARAVVGPQAVVEDRSIVASDCDISRSLVGPQTFIGKCTELRDSVAWGSTLLNWNTESSIIVPDPFLMCELGHSPAACSPVNWRDQLAGWYARNKEDLQVFWRDLLLHRGSWN